MADRKRHYRIGLAALLAISLFVCLLTGGVYAKGPVRQISFTQHITPLAMTHTAQALELGAPTAPTAVPEGTHIPVTDTAGFVAGLTSEEALEVCSEEWGDEDRGMCLAPGGRTYYVWIEPGTVMEVVIDHTQIWQEDLQDAVEGAVADRKSIDRETFGEIVGWVAVLGGALGIIPGCASVIGCIVAVGAFGGGLAEIAISENTISELEISLCDHSRDAIFNYCMMQGLGDAACRESAGYDQPCTPRPSGPCNPRTPCVPH